MALFDGIARRLDDRYATSDYRFVLTPTGAFRAALDNELTARKDVRFAVLATSLGIGALLILAFPRPYIGIASLLPAVFGTSIAFFAYSVVHEKISILTLGFGSAIVSITVDHGIAYLMFLDRPALTRGRDAAREVFAVSLFAAATTIGAFLALHLSGFKILAQTGLFAALGILFSFLFVHTLFPLLCPFTPPAPANRRSEAFLRFITAIATRGGKWKVCAAAILAVFLLLFARPKFETDIRAMNTVSNETQAAEQLVRKVWGNLFDKVFLLLEGRELDQLRLDGDRLVGMLEEDIRSGILNRAFASGMIFPGEARKAQNFFAWKRFWNPGRKEKLEKNLKEIGRSLGFSDNAFRPFLDMIHRTDPPDVKIPGPLFELLGITNSRDGSIWMEFVTASPGDHYEAERFFSRYSSTNTARVFDPVLFGERLGVFLARTFVRMAIIVSICTVFLLLVFFFDLTLALVSCVPILFAFGCTLGTLRLMGSPLGIPELMLSIVVMGMGIDYSVFFVRSYQRYYPSRPALLNLVQGTVFLAASSTLIGFATLYFAQHRLLKQAGLSSFLGIFYCLLGVFALLPPILAHIYGVSRHQSGTKKDLVSRVSSRYRYKETLPRLVVPFKLKSASWLGEIAKLIDIPETVIDLSGAFGAYATALAELFPGVRVFAVEHDGNRARIAAGALGENGMVLQNLSEVHEVTDGALWVASAGQMDTAGVMEQVRALGPKVRAGGTLVMVALDSRVSRLLKTWDRGSQRFRLENQPLKIEKALGRLDFDVVEWRRTSGGDLLVVSTKR
jgi:predicted exporter